MKIGIAVLVGILLPGTYHAAVLQAPNVPSNRVAGPGEVPPLMLQERSSCVTPPGPANCRFGYKRQPQPRLSCDFDNPPNVTSPAASFHLLPVCHPIPMVYPDPWINSAYYKYQFARTDHAVEGEGALMSNCTRNIINYSNTTGLACSMLMDPNQATASLQTGLYGGYVGKLCVRYFVSFWYKLDGPVKIADKTDPDRFFLELVLHHIDDVGHSHDEHPNRTIWGSTEEDYLSACYTVKSWSFAQVEFTVAGGFSINFFAHHNDGCTSNVRAIHLDSVVTSSESQPQSCQPEAQPVPPQCQTTTTPSSTISLESTSLPGIFTTGEAVELSSTREPTELTSVMTEPTDFEQSARTKGSTGFTESLDVSSATSELPDTSKHSLFPVTSEFTEPSVSSESTESSVSSDTTESTEPSVSSRAYGAQRFKRTNRTIFKRAYGAHRFKRTNEANGTICFKRTNGTIYFKCASGILRLKRTNRTICFKRAYGAHRFKQTNRTNRTICFKRTNRTYRTICFKRTSGALLLKRTKRTICFKRAYRARRFKRTNGTICVKCVYGTLRFKRASEALRLKRTNRTNRTIYLKRPYGTLCFKQINGTIRFKRAYGIFRDNDPTEPSISSEGTKPSSSSDPTTYSISSAPSKPYVSSSPTMHSNSSEGTDSPISTKPTDASPSKEPTNSSFTAKPTQFPVSTESTFSSGPTPSSTTMGTTDLAKSTNNTDKVGLRPSDLVYIVTGSFAGAGILLLILLSVYYARRRSIKRAAFKRDKSTVIGFDQTPKYPRIAVPTTPQRPQNFYLHDRQPTMRPPPESEHGYVEVGSEPNRGPIARSVISQQRPGDRQFGNFRPSNWALALQPSRTYGDPLAKNEST
ncbi:hypothetical protein BV898_03096 [Hypsibius exemplaris]|uniref:MAM domain-containing protein n=1 Tax=Hypsibius exemplaris TaxID=2072580 RepID=A0A1W0X6M5_HYPEX|nr:hypothetical protein BV898_03096 [Hypsibius exemplaris]